MFLKICSEGTSVHGLITQGKGAGNGTVRKWTPGVLQWMDEKYQRRGGIHQISFIRVRANGPGGGDNKAGGLCKPSPFRVVHRHRHRHPPSPIRGPSVHQATMVEKTKIRKDEVVTREYTINLHKRLHGWY